MTTTHAFRIALGLALVAVSFLPNGCSKEECIVPIGGPVSIEISSTEPIEAHVYTTGSDRYGKTPHKLLFTEEEACQWGLEIAARVSQEANPRMPWLGCDYGAPSLNTVTVKVKGVVVKGTPKHHPWACGGKGEGNLFFSPTVLGCSKKK
jgi:hypothetical protein